MTTQRRTHRMVAAGVLACVTAFVATVCGGPPRYLPKTAIEVFQIPAVAKDLGLTEDQLVQFKSLAGARIAAMADLGSALRDNPPNPAKVVEDHKATLQELESQAIAVLTPTQKTRLAQILRQFAARREGNAFGLSSKSLGDELKLTDSQKRAIREKAAEVEMTMDEKLAKLRKEMERVVLEGRADIVNVLTNEQKAKYWELMGPDFDMSVE